MLNHRCKGRFYGNKEPTADQMIAKFMFQNPSPKRLIVNVCAPLFVCLFVCLRMYNMRFVSASYGEATFLKRRFSLL